MSAPRLAHIRLVGFPVEVHRRAGEHSEALRRELAFVEHAKAADAAPARLEALTVELAGRYGGLTTAQSERIATAIEAGEQAIDLEFELPEDVVDDAAHLGKLLDELDDLCRDGALLTMVTPPDLVAYRRWFLGEFERQVRHSLPPQPWRDPAAADPESAHPDTGPGPCAVVVVEDDLDLASAPGLRRAILEHVDAGATQVTLDLSRCQFMDSTGLSLLVTTHHRLVEAGGGLRLEGVTAPVRGVLEMAGATEFFDQA